MKWLKHIFQKGTKDLTLLLLHGTGGNEYDLLSIGKAIDKEANILSVRGNVLENGMPRFFKRLEMGVFDKEDLVFRTKELNDFIDEASQTYGFDRSKVIAVGYSNGANIAGSLLFHIKDALSGAILFHPMVPRRGVAIPDLSDVKVFIGAGENDPICPREESVELVQLLSEAHANVTEYWTNQGHRLTQDELVQAINWYHIHFNNN